jgi:hypothetical protein
MVLSAKKGLTDIVKLMVKEKIDTQDQSGTAALEII